MQDRQPITLRKLPHFAIPQRPDFLEDSFSLFVTEDSRQAFELGRKGQGYIGLLNLQTGEIHLRPAFNKDDGLLRVDKNGHPFKGMVESSQPLGTMTGDLHAYFLSQLGLGELGGVNGHIMGFGIWKAGCNVKFLTDLPPREARIPNEYLVISNEQKIELIYINNRRQAEFIDANEIEDLSNLLNEWHQFIQNPSKHSMISAQSEGSSRLILLEEIADLKKRRYLLTDQLSNIDSSADIKKIAYINEDLKEINLSLREKERQLREFNKIKRLERKRIEINDIEKSLRSAIETKILSYHARSNPIDQIKVGLKYVKNRSSSQNAFSCRYTDLYKSFFKLKHETHQAHSLNLVRELPASIFKKILDAITDQLNLDSIDLLTDQCVPRGQDGIMEHFKEEYSWLNLNLENVLKEFYSIRFLPREFDVIWDFYQHQVNEDKRHLLIILFKVFGINNILKYAAQRGDVAFFKEQIAVIKRNINLTKFLPRAVTTANVKIVELLLQNGAQLNEGRRDELVVALAKTIKKNKDPENEMLNFFIENKINLAIPDEQGLTFLSLMVRHHKSDIIKKLLDSNVDLNINFLITDPLTGFRQTVLLMAVTSEDINVVKILLRHHANPNTVDSNGDTPLHSSVERANIKLVNLLLKYGANPCIDLDDFKTPEIESAIKNKQFEKFKDSYLKNYQESFIKTSHHEKLAKFTSIDQIKAFAADKPNSKVATIYNQLFLKDQEISAENNLYYSKRNL